MKIIHTLFALAILSLTTYGQKKKTNEDANVTIYAPITSVLYIGVDNPIFINATGIDTSELSVKLIGPGTLTQTADGYMAKLFTVGKCEIEVSKMVKGEQKVICQQTYRIKRIPDPIPLLSKKLGGGNIRTSTLALCTTVTAVLAGVDFDAKFPVVSFQMTICTSGLLYKLESTGPEFTAQMLEFVSKAKKNDVFIFDEIKVVGPDNQPRKLGQMAFTIIE